MDTSDAPDAPLTDPIGTILGLSPDIIRQRIDEIDRERHALLVLLRAATRAKQRDAQPKAVSDAR